jgi:hypothetical protein
MSRAAEPEPYLAFSVARCRRGEIRFLLGGRTVRHTKLRAEVF